LTNHIRELSLDELDTVSGGKSGYIPVLPHTPGVDTFDWGHAEIVFHQLVGFPTPWIRR
jgi:hypothetical protein